MSNLSDLLPAGAGAKVITATADGNLTTGQTVALQSNGTVKGVSSTARSISEAVGTAAVYESATSDANSVAYDSTNKKLLIVYSDAGNSGYGTAVVATLSGSTLTYGTPVVFYSATADDITIVYSSTADKFVISWNQSGGRSIVGTVSGTTVSFGSENRWSTNNIDHTVSAYDSGNDKVVVAYQDGTQSDYGFSRVGTISGTSISFGSETQFSTSSHGFVFQLGITYDSTNSKIIIVYATGSSSSGKGRASVGTVSGTSISFGSPTIYGDNEQTRVNRAVYDVGQNKIFVAYRESTNVYGIIGTVSGTSISFGTRVSLMTSASTDFASVAYHTAAQKVVYSGRKSNNELTAIICTVSGTTFSKGSDIKLADQGDENGYSAYDSTEEQVVVAYRDVGNSNYGTAITITPAYTATNSSDFAGITNQAINNSASGEVVVEGGVITNSSLVPDVPVISVGTAGDTSDTGQHMAAAYDANAQRVVTFYRDNNNSNYGTSAVGTVSGTSITFGTPVVFNSASTTECTAAYNSTAQKVMVAFNSAGSTGKAIYGAVSGTTIDFSSYTVTQFDSNNISEMQVVFDTNAEKMVIAYKLPGSESQLGKAVVGTLSGTTLSFGTAVTFNNAATTKCAAAYDSTNNKVVISYSDAGNSNYPTSIVGTVSGTSISFGSETVIANVSGSYIATTYDSGNQKIIVSYQDVSDSNAGKVAIGTVSGTNITFGTPVAFPESLAVGGWLSSAYDPDNGIVALNFKNNSGNAGTCVPAIVSGSTFSFGASVVFETGSTEYTSTVYDTNADKFVVAFNDGGASDQGRAVVQTSSKTVGLTIGSTYYVQDDGTLATTSSSVTAGKALANTTLLLKG